MCRGGPGTGRVWRVWLAAALALCSCAPAAAQGWKKLGVVLDKVQVNDVAFFPTGDQFVTGDAKGTIATWNIAPPPIPPVQALDMEQGKGGTTAVHVSPDAAYIVACGNENMRVFDAAGILQAETEALAFIKCRFGPARVDGRVLIFAGGRSGFTGAAALFEFTNGALMELAAADLGKASSEIVDVSFSPDGLHVGVAARSEARVFLISENGAAWSIIEDTSKRCAKDNRDERVLAVEFAPNGELLALGTSSGGPTSGSIAVCEISTGQRRALPRVHGNWVNSVAWGAGSKTLFSASGDGYVKAFDVPPAPAGVTANPSSSVQVTDTGNSFLVALELSPTNKYLLVGTYIGAYLYTDDTRTPAPPPPTPAPPTPAPPTPVPPTPVPPTPAPATPAPPTPAPATPAPPTPAPATPVPPTPAPATPVPPTPAPATPVPPTPAPATPVPPTPAPATPVPSTPVPPTPAPMSPQPPATPAPAPAPGSSTPSPPSVTTPIPATGSPAATVPPATSVPPTAAPVVTGIPTSAAPQTPLPSTRAPRTSGPLPLTPSSTGTTTAPVATPVPGGEPPSPPPPPLTIDECDTVCATCANATCSGAGQECVDGDQSTTAVGDWVCRCRAPEKGVRRGGAAVCEPPVIDEEVKETVEAISKGVLVSAAAGTLTGNPAKMGTVTGTAGKLAILRNIDCYVDEVDIQGEATPLDFEFYPIGVGLGPRNIKYIVGAVVLNYAMLLAFLVLVYLIAILLSCWYRMAFSKALGIVKAPGIVYIPYLFVLQGTSLASSQLLFYPAHSGVWAILGGVVLAVTIASVYLIHTRILRRVDEKATAIPDPVVAARLNLGTETGSPALLEPERSFANESRRSSILATSGQTRVLTGVKRSLYVFTFGEWIWVSRYGGSRFAEQYGTVFEAVQPGKQWVLSCELISILVLSLMANYKPHDIMFCNARNFVITAMLTIFFLTLLVQRPYISTMDNLFAVTLAGLLAALVLCISIAIAWTLGPESFAIRASTYMMITADIMVQAKAAWDLLAYFTDLCIHRRGGVRKQARAVCKVEAAKNEVLPTYELVSLHDMAAAGRTCSFSDPFSPPENFALTQSGTRSIVEEAIPVHREPTASESPEPLAMQSVDSMLEQQRENSAGDDYVADRATATASASEPSDPLGSGSGSGTDTPRAQRQRTLQQLRLRSFPTTGVAQGDSSATVLASPMNPLVRTTSGPAGAVSTTPGRRWGRQGPGAAVGFTVLTPNTRPSGEPAAAAVGGKASTTTGNGSRPAMLSPTRVSSVTTLSAPSTPKPSAQADPAGDGDPLAATAGPMATANLRSPLASFGPVEKRRSAGAASLSPRRCSSSVALDVAGRPARQGTTLRSPMAASYSPRQLRSVMSVPGALPPRLNSVEVLKVTAPPAAVAATAAAGYPMTPLSPETSLRGTLHVEGSGAPRVVPASPAAPAGVSIAGTSSAKGVQSPLASATSNIPAGLGSPAPSGVGFAQKISPNSPKAKAARMAHAVGGKPGAPGDASARGIPLAVTWESHYGSFGSADNSLCATATSMRSTPAGGGAAGLPPSSMQLLAGSSISAPPLPPAQTPAAVPKDPLNVTSPTAGAASPLADRSASAAPTPPHDAAASASSATLLRPASQALLTAKLRPKSSPKHSFVEL